MFEEEARLGAELVHPNIVQILDFGRDEEEEPYLVMEWIEGVDLYQWIRSFERVRERTPWPVVVGIGIEVLRALTAAHERVGRDGQPAPVYHRDISPSNILLDYRGIV
ncbi:MAG: protein kinase, partial [Deltaproteobacteria bacterium]|nr:protein kinase [Deltaproteobacteria bacterium]